MWTVQVSEKVLLLVLISSRAREINSRYGGETRWHMFLLVPGRYVDAFIRIGTSMESP